MLHGVSGAKRLRECVARSDWELLLCVVVQFMTHSEQDKMYQVSQCALSDVLGSGAARALNPLETSTFSGHVLTVMPCQCCVSQLSQLLHVIHRSKHVNVSLMLKILTLVLLNTVIITELNHSRVSVSNQHVVVVWYIQMSLVWHTRHKVWSWLASLPCCRTRLWWH